MTVTEKSRYSEGVFAWVDDPTRGRVQIVHLYPMRWNSQPYSTVVSSQGDRFDTLSYRKYGDSTQFWLIAEMNPTVNHPDDLLPGTELQIPIQRA